MRTGAGHVPAFAFNRLAQSCDKIPRKKRRIGRNADQPGYIRPVFADPLHTRQNARERARKPFDGILNDRKPIVPKPGRIAVGIQDKRLDLGPDTFNDMA